MSHSEKLPVSRGVPDPLVYEIFPQPLVRDFNQLCRRERSHAFLNLRFNATVLGILEEPKIFEKEEDSGTTHHTMYTNCLDEKGVVRDLITVLMTSESPHPDPTLFAARRFTMAAYKFRLSTLQIVNSPVATADLDPYTHRWLKINGGFGPFVQNNEGFVNIVGWNNEVLPMSHLSRSPLDASVAESLSSHLGKFEVDDSQPFSIWPGSVQ